MFFVYMFVCVCVCAGTFRSFLIPSSAYNFFVRCLNCMYPQSRSLFSLQCGVDFLLLFSLLREKHTLSKSTDNIHNATKDEKRKENKK